MRSEAQMMSLITNTAKKDHRIRAVVLNGSRADSYAPKDCYQDYDVVYFVTDFHDFVHNIAFIDIFGERIILEMPAYKDLDPTDYNGSFNYQMLFTDGNRIDLTFTDIRGMEEAVREDRVGKVLLDKDGLLKDTAFLDGEHYFVRPFSSLQFENACNCFWWIVQNVAKGLARKELPYAMNMLHIAREDLDKIVSWYIGLQNEFKVSTGKMGKYFERYLSPALWEKYKSGYPSGDYDCIWASLFHMCELFRMLGISIADQCGYPYPSRDDERMTAYLILVKEQSNQAR